jgi:thiamine-phosphate pyrophosphorylase
MKRYLITDPKYYGNTPQQARDNLQNVLDKHHVDMVCFRDKHAPNFLELAVACVETCYDNNIFDVYINGDIGVAFKSNAKGVHLTSTQFDEIARAKDLGLETIISTHTVQEIELAIENKADCITYSPIFFTPNKGTPKGVEELHQVVKNYSIPIIALGGIVTQEQIDLIEQKGVHGFASIRYFIK